MNTQQNKNIAFLIIMSILGITFLLFANKSEDSTNKDNKFKKEQLEKIAPVAKQKKQLDPNKEPKLILTQPEKMSPGLTLVPRYSIPEITLVNDQGEVVKSWEINARRARLLPNCNLLIVHKKHNFHENGIERDTSSLASEYNWEGKLINEYPVSGEIHHDVQLLSNNQILLLHRYYLPKSSERLNYKSLLHKYPNYTLKFDAIQITDLATKQKVFEWDFLESFKATSCGNFACPWKSKRFIRSDADHIDWTHVNSVSEVPKNKWFEMGHQEFKPGNLMITVRNWSAILILDKDSKKIVWEYGGKNHGGFEGGHDAYMIPEEFPGAGNILFFDNGDPRLKLDIHTGVSHVLEFNPITKENVWFFDADKTLLSISMGSAQRLRNGNTLISEDTSGRILEVTPSKEIVWHYETNRHTARAYRYELNYCAKF